MIVEAFYDDAMETTPLVDTYAVKPVRTDSGTPISNLYLFNTNPSDSGSTFNYKVKISLVDWPTNFAESTATITYPVPMLSTPGSNTLF